MDVEQRCLAARQLAEAGDTERAINLLTGEARVAAAGGRAPDAIEMVGLAASMASDTQTAARLHEMCATIAREASHPEAVDHFLRAADGYARHGRVEDETRAVLAAFGMQPSLRERADRLAQESAGRWGEALRAQISLFDNDWTSATRHADVAVQMARDSGDLLCEAHALLVRAIAASESGNVADAAADELRAAQILESIGRVVTATIARANLVDSLIGQLNTEQAVEQAVSDLRHTSSALNANVRAVAIAHWTCIHAHVAAGDLTQAVSLLESAPSMDALPPADVAANELLRAMLLAELGWGEQLDDAITAAQDAIAVFGYGAFAVRLDLVGAQRAWSRGRYDDAIELAKSIHDAAVNDRIRAQRLLVRNAAWIGRDVDVADTDGQGLTPLGQLLRDEVLATRAAIFGGGIESLEAVRMRWREAGCRLDAARAGITLLLALQGSRASEANVLQLVRDVFDELEQCGATGDLPFVASLLDAAGGAVASIGEAGFFGELDDQARTALKHFGKMRRVERSGYLSHDGASGDEALIIVLEGSVSIVKIAPNGRVLQLDVIERGGAFGSSSLAGGGVSDPMLEVVAEESSTVLVLDGAGLREAMSVAPSIGFTLARTLIGQAHRVQGIAEIVAFLPVEHRLQRMLLSLAGRWGHPTLDGGLVINRQFTHEQLAAMIGTTRKTVTRILGDLRNEGAISMRGRRIMIVDSSRLRPGVPD